MADRPPEGPKADYTAEESSGGAVPPPPDRKEVDRISEAQGLITDEWGGDSPEKDQVAPRKP